MCLELRGAVSLQVMSGGGNQCIAPKKMSSRAWATVFTAVFLDMCEGWVK